jgi:hypothetical protein
VHGRLFDKGVKRPDGVAAAADAGNHCVRQPALRLRYLLFDSSRRDSLEIADDGGKGCGPMKDPARICSSMRESPLRLVAFDGVLLSLRPRRDG